MKKRVTSLALALLMLVSLLPAAAVAEVTALSGEGTQASPYLIQNLDELEFVAAKVNGGNTAYNAAWYALTDNIGQPGISSFTDIIGSDETKPFKGHFDGTWHKVNLDIERSGDFENAGLFGYISAEAVIANVTTVGEVCSSGDFCSVGGICGWNEGGTITDCGNAAFIYSSSNGTGIGGICGWNAGIVRNCGNSGDVSGNLTSAGGVCGATGECTIVNCTNSGNVSGNGDYAGGVCGVGSDGAVNIYNCVNTGDVSVDNDDASNWAGGICGLNLPGGVTVTIINCISTGRLSDSAGVDYMGGIQTLSYGTVQNCYYDSTVTPGIDVVAMEAGTTVSSSGLATEVMQAESGTPGALIDLLNGYITANSGTTDGWLPWGKDEGGYPFLCYPQRTLTKIEAVTMPVKTDYIAGDDFDPTGLMAALTYDDGTVAKETGYAVASGTDLKAGQTEVGISYTKDGVTETVTVPITVVPKELTKIEVTTPPTKTLYAAGEDFDPTGMVVTATYNNVRTAAVTDYTVTGGTDMEVGQTEVGISYTENGVTKTDAVPVVVTVAGLSGEGTETDPYLIGTLDELNFVAIRVNANEEPYQSAYYRLTADIGQPGVSSFTDIIGSEDNPFKGHFDGAGHKVNLDIEDDMDDGILGLFGWLHAMATVANVTTTGEVYSSGEGTNGGICGYNDGGTITDCGNAAVVHNSSAVADIGGICGWNGGTVRNCTNSGYVSGNAAAGGVCGNIDGTIVNCTNSGIVEGKGFVGGVCGNSYGTIRNCVNSGAVNDAGGAAAVGGVCGASSTYVYGGAAVIVNCVNTGTVTGHDGIFIGFEGGSIGGVCGRLNYYGVIANCENTGDVCGGKDNVVGGVCGSNDASDIVNCISSGAVNGGSGAVVGGVCARNIGGTVTTNCHYDKDVATATDKAVYSGDSGLDTDGLTTEVMKAGSGTTGALIDLLNGYITDNPDTTDGWLTWVKDEGDYPHLRRLTGVSVTDSPAKTRYKKGADFDPDGMVVTAAYTVGAPVIVTDFTVNDGTDLQVGQTEVGISYTENGVTKTAAVPVTVTRRHSSGSETDAVNASLTGDVGTAIYAAMAMLSAAGSAAVVRKKKRDE